QPWQPPPGSSRDRRGSGPIVQAEPQPYHRLLVARGYAWWRPLLGVVVLGAAFFALTLLVTVVFVAIDAMRAGEAFDQAFERYPIEAGPLFLLWTNLSLAVAIPAAMLAIVVAHRLRPGWLSSVVSRLRWGLLARLSVLAFVIVAIFTVLNVSLPSDDEMMVDVADV